MVCKNCGYEIDNKADVCFHCGKNLKNKKTRPRALLVFGLIPIVIVVFFVFIVILSITAFNKDMGSATEYILSGELDKAKEILDEQLEKNPEQEQVYLVFAEYYLAQNRYFKAAEILEKGLLVSASTEEIKSKLDDIKIKYSKEIQEQELIEIQIQSDDETQKVEENKIDNEKKEDANKAGVSFDAFNNMLNACEIIGIGYADMTMISEKPDWAYGQRCSFRYKNCDFIVYFNQDGTVNSINIGLEKIYENGKKVKDLNDYITY